MARIDYFYKAFVLENYPDLLKKFQIASFNEYALAEYFENGNVLPSISKSLKNGKINNVYTFTDLIQECNGNKRLIKELGRLTLSSKKKLKRLREKVQSILKSTEATFITLTFTDTTLNTSTLELRRKRVSRFLKRLNCEYVGNIDFGKENEREHYHALISCRVDKDNAKLWRKYGNINFEKVRINRNNEDSTKLSKYIVKLSNHAIKDTTKRICLLYSR